MKTMREFMPLLGREWLNALFPTWRDAFKLNKLELDSKVELLRDKLIREIKRDFASLIDNDLSKLI